MLLCQNCEGGWSRQGFGVYHAGAVSLPFNGAGREELAAAIENTRFQTPSCP